MADTAMFDTLATARRLKAAGIVGAQAEAIAEAQAEAVAVAVRTARADHGALATKADLYRALLVLGAALAGFTVAVAAVGLMQALQ